MSATLGALVIAIATEFSVILAARYHEERGAGRSRRRGAAPHLRAHRHRRRRLGRHRDRRASRCSSPATSGCCATSAWSPSSTSRVALAGVMLVLPAALVWAEGGLRAVRRARRAAARPARPRATGAPTALSDDARPETRRTGAERREAPFRPGAATRSSSGSPSSVLIAVAADQRASAPTRAAMLGDRAQTAASRCAEFAVPDVRGGAGRATPTSPRTTARPPRTRARPTTARTPACEIDPEDAIRVCDLFDRPLVISFWFTTPARLPRRPRTRSTRVAARYRGRVNFLSVASAATATSSSGSSPSAAGRSRSAGTATAPSRTSIGSASARPSPSSSRAASSSEAEIGERRARRGAQLDRERSSGCRASAPSAGATRGERR